MSIAKFEGGGRLDVQGGQIVRGFAVDYLIQPLAFALGGFRGFSLASRGGGQRVSRPKSEPTSSVLVRGSSLMFVPVSTRVKLVPKIDGRIVIEPVTLDVLAAQVFMLAASSPVACCGQGVSVEV